jgi:hypothetical protein
VNEEVGAHAVQVSSRAEVTMRRASSTLILGLVLTAVGCGDDPEHKKPVEEDDSGVVDPCAELEDGAVVDEDPDAACGGFTHDCDPTGQVERQQVVCADGISTLAPLVEDCERDVVAENACAVYVGDITVHDADDIALLTGMDAVFGRIIVDIADTSGLESIEYVSGTVAMGVRDLSALRGLSGLVAIEGGVSLLCVTGSDLTMFANVETIEGDLTIVGAPGIVSLTLPSLTTLTGELELDWASSQACTGSTRTLFGLEEIGPFGPGLTRLGGLAVSSTRVMTGLGALTDITQIDGRVSFLDNTLLSECDIQDWLSEVEVAGETTLLNNADCQ